MRHLILAHGALDDVRRPCGAPLPLPHAWALLELLHTGPMTITQLTERLDVDRANVSRLCARMEALGELARVAHPDDGRARLLELTKRGQRAARAVDESSAAHFARVAARLGARSSHVVDALNALAEALSAPSTSERETVR